MRAADLQQKYIIDFKFEKVNKGAGDCRSQTFSTVLKHYGYNVDPIDLLGLGSAIDFKLNEVNYSGIDLLTIQGRDFEAERRCCNLLNIEFIQRIWNAESNEDQCSIPFNMDILSRVANNQPVILNCDVYYMKYLTHIKLSHNRYHMVVIVGFDLEQKTLTVYDSLSEELQTISMEQMRKAIFEPGLSVLETGLWYELKVNNKGSSYEIPDSYYIDSVKKQAEKMLLKEGYLDEFVRFIKFVERINRRAKEGSNNHIKYLQVLLDANCLLIRRQDEINGTIYRTIYSNYLKKNYHKFHEENQRLIRSAIELMNEIEKGWRTIAFKGRYASGDITKKCDLVLEVLRNLNNGEKKLAKLLSMVKSM